MKKQPRTISSRLPPYVSKDNGFEWRRRILSMVRQARDEAKPSLLRTAKVEVIVLFYLAKVKRSDKQDVDNLLKHVLDALQGHVGGPKSRKAKNRIIRNDTQVCRVVVEKQYRPKMYSGRDEGGLVTAGGRIRIRPYREHKWPLQASKGHRLKKAHG